MEYKDIVDKASALIRNKAITSGPVPMDIGNVNIVYIGLRFISLPTFAAGHLPLLSIDPHVNPK